MKQKESRPQNDGRHDELLRGTRPAIDAKLINAVLNAKDVVAPKDDRVSKSDVGTPRVTICELRRSRTPRRH